MTWLVWRRWRKVYWDFWLLTCWFEVSNMFSNPHNRMALLICLHNLYQDYPSDTSWKWRVNYQPGKYLGQWHGSDDHSTVTESFRKWSESALLRPFGPLLGDWAADLADSASTNGQKASQWLGFSRAQGRQCLCTIQAWFCTCQELRTEVNDMHLTGSDASTACTVVSPVNSQGSQLVDLLGPWNQCKNK